MQHRNPAIAALCLALLFGGCARKDAPRLTLAVGGAPNEVSFWKTVARDFEGETGLAVGLRIQPADTGQRRQGLLIPLKARQPDPDVFLMDVAWIAQFAASGWLQSLDEGPEDTRPDRHAFFEGILRSVDEYGGRLLALPVYVDAGLLYYREDLLKRFGVPGPPRTWGDLVLAADKIQPAMRREVPGFYGFLWQGAQYEGLVCVFLEFAASHSGGIHIRNGKLVLDTPENRRALELMKDLIHRYGLSPPNTYTDMKEETVRRAFQDGRGLFERNWPYAWSLHQAEDSPVRGKTGITVLPHAPGSPAAAALGGWHIGISRASDRKPQARLLVKYLTSREVQKRLALNLGWSPARKDLYEDADILAKLPHFSELKKVFLNAVPRPLLPYYSQISDILQRALNAALAGELSAEEALSGAEDEAGKIVRRYTAAP